eukprot:4130320-Pyramimonas_sp.AAC.1
MPSRAELSAAWAWDSARRLLRGGPRLEVRGSRLEDRGFRASLGLPRRPRGNGWIPREILARMQPRT